MAKPKFDVAMPGRVITKDGKPYLLLAVPQAFFPTDRGATLEEADAAVYRIAHLLTEHGE